MSKPIYPINEVLSNFRRLVPHGEKILISCSGGADSMALLFCAQKTGNPVHVFHVVHDMRSLEDSMKDHDLVKSYCIKHNIPFSSNQAKLKTMPCFSEKDPTENDYREFRKLFLEKVCEENKCKFVATGHHADDQLETILMKLCRGSGLRGMSGIAESMPYSNFNYVRPLLSISKENIYDICKLNDIPFNEDCTNTDVQYTRNALRHKVLPVLKSIFPNCSENSNNAAGIFRDAQSVIEKETFDILKYETDNIEFDYEDRLINKPCVSIKIEALRLSNDIVIYEWLRSTYAKIVRYYAPINFDSINKTMADKVIKAVREHQSIGFVWPNDVKIRINKNEVKMYHE